MINANPFLDADFQWYVKDDGNTEPTQPSDNPTTPTDPTKPSQSGGGSGSGSHGGLTARTGDTAHIVLWCVFAICALAIIILLIKSRRDKKLAGEDLDDSDSETHKKLRRSMFIAVLLALMLGVTPLTAIASFAAVSALFVLPTYPTLLAAVEMDDTGSTRIGKYVFNHAFLIPGVVAITLCVILGFIIGGIVL